ncbi:hypothetical protein C8034_v006038 [Colletotrichum sidae]|uniref:Laminin-like protein epi-1 n=1 Tax=Colletotrichum sidae TaxID=1347389 RepID=A0A4R8T566_9PEZI|nr:hypothetical protein C8034_v006038 [Colletotrichum sidae]
MSVLALVVFLILFLSSFYVLFHGHWLSHDTIALFRANAVRVTAAITIGPITALFYFHSPTLLVQLISSCLAVANTSIQHIRRRFDPYHRLTRLSFGILQDMGIMFLDWIRRYYSIVVNYLTKERKTQCLEFHLRPSPVNGQDSIINEEGDGHATHKAAGLKRNHHTQRVSDDVPIPALNEFQAAELQRTRSHQRVTHEQPITEAQPELPTTHDGHCRSYQTDSDLRELDHLNDKFHDLRRSYHSARAVNDELERQVQDQNAVIRELEERLAKFRGMDHMGYWGVIHDEQRKRRLADSQVEEARNMLAAMNLDDNNAGSFPSQIQERDAQIERLTAELQEQKAIVRQVNDRETFLNNEKDRIVRLEKARSATNIEKLNSQWVAEVSRLSSELDEARRAVRQLRRENNTRCDESSDNVEARIAEETAKSQKAEREVELLRRQIEEAHAIGISNEPEAQQKQHQLYVEQAQRQVQHHFDNLKEIAKQEAIQQLQQEVQAYTASKDQEVRDAIENTKQEIEVITADANSHKQKLEEYFSEKYNEDREKLEKQHGANFETVNQARAQIEQDRLRVQEDEKKLCTDRVEFERERHVLEVQQAHAEAAISEVQNSRQFLHDQRQQLEADREKLRAEYELQQQAHSVVDRSSEVLEIREQQERLQQARQQLEVDRTQAAEGHRQLVERNTREVLQLRREVEAEREIQQRKSDELKKKMQKLKEEQENMKVDKEAVQLEKRSLAGQAQEIAKFWENLRKHDELNDQEGPVNGDSNDEDGEGEDEGHSRGDSSEDGSFEEDLLLSPVDPDTNSAETPDDFMALLRSAIDEREGERAWTAEDEALAGSSEEDGSDDEDNAAKRHIREMHKRQESNLRRERSQREE